MATENELKSVLGEGKFRDFIDRTKNFLKNDWKRSFRLDPKDKKKIAAIFKPNKGMTSLLIAMDKMAKKNIKFEDISIWATLGTETYPVVGFAFKNDNNALMILIDKDNKSAAPKTLKELRKWFIDNNIKLKTDIDAVVCAEAPESLLSESVILEMKMGDYITSKKLTKKQALKADVVKDISRKVTHKTTAYTKAAIERYFAKNSPAKKTTSASSSSKNSSKRSSSKKSLGKPTKTSAPTNPPPPPASKTTSGSSTAPASFDHADGKTVDDPNSLTVYDNKFINVGQNLDRKAVAFCFSKPAAELALDKKAADLFEL